MNKIKHKYRLQLIAMRDELDALRDVGAAAAEVVALDQTKVGRLSRMDALQAQAMSIASGIRREAQRRLIELALARLEDGTFGHCRSCDEEISRGRLEFDPTALMCIDCAEKSERDGG